MKLSVMMITYNHERFIAQALESILAQRVNFDYEIVVGEDCSTDRTRDILMDFYNRYPDRIVPLIRDRNLGMMRNLEQTLSTCRGQYVALIEGDDYWTSNYKLQRQVDFLDAHPDRAICCHHVKFLDETGPAEVDVFPELSAGLYSINDLLKGNFIMTCSAVLRRDFVPSLPRWLGAMKLGDWPMFALAATHGNIELMGEVMAVYRVHAGSSWSSLSFINRLDESSRMLRTLDRHLGYKYSETIRQTIAHPYLELALAARLKGNRKETAKHLASCIHNGGWRLPGKRRVLASIAAYVIIGARYRAFSRLKGVK